MTYAELAALRRGPRGRARGRRAGSCCSRPRNDVDTVVTYLAALAGGTRCCWPRRATRAARRPRRPLPARRRPGVGQRLREVRPGTAHDLHPDLALLLTTSGSTGSPKLVRLSLANVLANARSIAEYLGLRDTDRAITSLPLHYCYGLSVLNSHLVSGAAVVLTELSVADACFWDLVDDTGATSFAGVPVHLRAARGRPASATGAVPSLRYLTQAGGRMDPARVREYAELGRRRGWDLFVMYGQTEATARMAYLPPDLAAEHPDAVGVPIPGGAFRLDAVGDDGADGVGELVYTGPNVMMGYADSSRPTWPAAPSSTELRTGDLARQADDGLWEVVGRLGRHAKLFGLRLDLDRVERLLADQGRAARVLVHDERLWVFTDRPRAVERTRRAVLDLTGLPASAVRVVRLDALPRTSRGQARLRRAAPRHAERTRADDADRPGVGHGRGHPRPVRRPAGPPRRDDRRQLRRPRR